MDDVDDDDDDNVDEVDVMCFRICEISVIQKQRQFYII
jgi:hypothetical protein